VSTARSNNNAIQSQKQNASDKSKSQSQNSGTVTFYSRPGATKEEVKQIVDYCAGCNRALKEGQLAPSGRISTKGALRDDANNAAYRERAAATSSGKPYSGVVAHVPDATWSGKANPAQGWMDMSHRVNSSLGAQSGNYPLGYQPTGFFYGGPK